MPQGGENKNMQPIIKWTGSKRSQAKNIISYFPNKIETYYEPFLGGGSVLLELLESKKIDIKNYIVSDINKDLINLWNIIKNEPEKLIEHYSILHKEFNNENFQQRKKYFNYIRDRYNLERDPRDFFFLTRTSINGLIRYNKIGNFNSSCHFTRPGIDPKKINKIILNVSGLIKDVHFLQQDYSEMDVQDADFIYLDPPYYTTKEASMYYGKLEEADFFNWLKTIYNNWALSYNGYSENNKNIHNIEKIYKRHILIESGVSSFRRLISQKTEIMHESLYLNF